MDGTDKMLRSIREKLDANNGLQVESVERLEKLEKNQRATEAWVSELELRLGQVGRQSGEAPFNVREYVAKLGMFLYLSVRACVTKDDSRLREYAQEQGWVLRAPMQEDTGSEGGWSIPTEQYPGVYGLPGPSGVVSPISAHWRMTSKTMNVPNIATEPTVAIVGEEAVIPESNATLGQMTLVAKKFSSISTISTELLQDSTVDWQGWYLMKQMEKIGQLEDAQALEGDGAGTNFTGLFSAAGVNSVSVAGTPTNLDKFIDALATLPAAVRNGPGLNWFFHPRDWKTVSKLKHPQYSGDTAGNYVMNPIPTQGSPLSLLGYPVRLCDQISVTRGGGTDGTAYVGHFGQGMVFGDRMPLELGVNPYVNWTTSQVSLRIMQRTGILVAIPSAFCKLTGIQP